MLIEDITNDTDGIYTMFLDWKNQYCQNDPTIQGNIQIECNPYPITNRIFHRTLLVEMLTATAAVENSMEFPQKC